MNFRELKDNSLTHKVFRELLQAISKKPYVNEETLVSEEAEKLLKNYKYLYSHTKKPEYAKGAYFLKSCILSHYQSFDEVVSQIYHFLEKDQNVDIDQIIKACQVSEFSKGMKYSTFQDVISFLNLK